MCMSQSLNSRTSRVASKSPWTGFEIQVIEGYIPCCILDCDAQMKRSGRQGRVDRERDGTFETWSLENGGEMIRAYEGSCCASLRDLRWDDRLLWLLVESCGRQDEG
jgi:hypothetical protein